MRSNEPEWHQPAATMRHFFFLFFFFFFVFFSFYSSSLLCGASVSGFSSVVFFFFSSSFLSFIFIWQQKWNKSAVNILMVEHQQHQPWIIKNWWIWLKLGMTGWRKEKGEEEDLEEVKRQRVGEVAAGLIAGFGAVTAPGRSEHGSPTLCNVCTRHHDDQTPWCTGNHGNLGTGSTPNWRRYKWETEEERRGLINEKQTVCRVSNLQLMRG